MGTETPRQQIDRLNKEQRAIWDGQKTFDHRDRRAARLQDINTELQNAWAAERVARAKVSNPQRDDVPLLPRRQR